ncbi:osteoclast-stimulating factor 1-like protein [Camelus ferus]|nr:osteoclast-stimulating factor 1-like protein [Camelus ferus]
MGVFRQDSPGTTQCCSVLISCFTSNPIKCHIKAWQDWIDQHKAALMEHAQHVLCAGDELYFEEGDIIYITDMSDTNWWKGTSKGRTGLIPSNYVAEQAESIDNPLHEAAKRDIVEMLFTQPNIELNQQNKLGDTALHAAAWKGYADIVQLLLAKGARTDLRNNEKKLALDMATNAACASLLKKKQGTDAVRTLSNAEDYLDDEDSD